MIQCEERIYIDGKYLQCPNEAICLVHEVGFCKEHYKIQANWPGAITKFLTIQHYCEKCKEIDGINIFSLVLKEGNKIVNAQVISLCEKCQNNIFSNLLGHKR